MNFDIDSMDQRYTTFLTLACAAAFIGSALTSLNHIYIETSMISDDSPLYHMSCVKCLDQGIVKDVRYF